MSGKRRYRVNKVAPAELTATMVRDRLDYDPHTGIFRWKASPCNNTPAGTIAGTKNRNGYIVIKLLHSIYSAHRLAWLHVHGVWPAGFLAHADGNKSNNVLSNLREATASQNQFNIPCRGYYFHAASGM